MEMPKATSTNSGTQINNKPLPKIVVGPICNFLLICFAANGQAEPERASFAFLRFNAYLATMHLDNFFAYWKPQTGASLFSCIRDRHLLKSLKNCLAHMSRNTSAFVRNSDLNLVIQRLCADDDRGRRW